MPRPNETHDGGWIEMDICVDKHEVLAIRLLHKPAHAHITRSVNERFVFCRVDHELSVACYPKKVVMWDQAAAAVRNGDDRDMAMLSSSLVVNIGATKRSIENGFVEILDGPTGFMCIHRSVFKKLEEKFPELWCKNDHQNRDFDEYHACFDCMIDPESKRYLSEDYAFCRRWQQAGGKIYADVNTTLGHVGNLPFSACLDDRLKV